MGFITSTDADVYGAYGAWDYEGGALNNPEMQHAAGGSAIENPRRWRSRREMKKQIKRLRRKNRRIRKKVRRAGHMDSRMIRAARQVEQDGTPQYMSLEQQGPPPNPYTQHRRRRSATADQAANMELAGILGFGLDHASQARTNALQILDLGLGAITEEAYLDDYGNYGDRESRIKARQASKSKRVKKRQAKKSKRVKRRVDIRHARQEARKGRRAERKAGRAERQSYRQG